MIVQLNIIGINKKFYRSHLLFCSIDVVASSAINVEVQGGRQVVKFVMVVENRVIASANSQNLGLRRFHYKRWYASHRHCDCFLRVTLHSLVKRRNAGEGLDAIFVLGAKI